MICLTSLPYQHDILQKKDQSNKIGLFHCATALQLSRCLDDAQRADNSHQLNDTNTTRTLLLAASNQDPECGREQC